MTVEQLKLLLNGNSYVSLWYTALTKFFHKYDIDANNKRIAAFMAECCVESGDFTTVKENLNYSAEALLRVWPSHFNADNVNKYAHKPEAIANRAYANRMGNGDELSGDGFKFSGKGLLQLTGRNNYQDLADDLAINIEDLPHYLITFDGAVESACWFWNKNNLSPLADAGNIDKISRTINGGDNGIEQRRAKYQSALKILGN